MRCARDQLVRCGEAIDVFLEQWIGYALPPVPRVMRESDWTADAPGAYCHRCGGSVGRGEATGEGCAACRGRPAPADAVVRLGPYRGPLREWIIDIKFRHRWIEMARHLGDRLGEAVLATEAIDHRRAIVVPMPMPWQRRLYRGIDHARTISAGVARRLDAPLRPLLRKANGPPQAGQAATGRRAAAARGLSLAGSGPPRAGVLAGRDVVLVDDVATTGASAGAAARLLRTLGPRRIAVAVLAVADARGRAGAPEDRPASSFMSELPRLTS